MRTKRVLTGGLIGLSIFGAAAAGCGGKGDDKGGDGGGGSGGSEAGLEPTFTNVYTEILQPSCGSTGNTASCHQAAASVPPASQLSFLDFSSQTIAYSSLVNVQAMGTYCGVADGGALPTRVVPGNAQGSLLYQKVADAMPPCGSRMPKPIPPKTTVAVLSSAQIALIADWISDGAKGPN
jgi:hypothetical protein